MIHCTGHASAEDSGRSFALAFMNITPDVNDEGFIQIFVVSTNVTTVNVQVAHRLLTDKRCSPAVCFSMSLSISLPYRVLT